MKNALLLLLCLSSNFSCNKSENESTPDTTVEIVNSLNYPVLNLLIAYKIGSTYKLHSNLGYFDRGDIKEIDFDPSNGLEIYVYYDAVESGVSVTKMITNPFIVKKSEKNSIQISPINHSKAVSKTSPEYPGSNPDSGQVRMCGKHNGKQLYRGPDGGCYYINSNGNKTYVARSECNC